MSVDIAAYDPRREDERRYLTAIARRNTAWARWQDALVLLAIARDEISFDDLRPYVRNVNETQHEYEHAERDLARARVHWQTASARAAA